MKDLGINNNNRGTIKINDPYKGTTIIFDRAEALKKLEMLDIPDEQTESERVEMEKIFSEMDEEIKAKKLKKGITLSESSNHDSMYLNKSDIRDQLEIMPTTDEEKLVWIFQTIKKTKEKNGLSKNDPVYIGFDEIIVKPFFVLKTFEWDFESLLSSIKNDKDFLRKHNMESYNPSFEVDPLCNGEKVIQFSDFTDDFIKEYMEDRLGIQSISPNNNNPHIEKIEILKDNSDRKAIVLYINGNYDIPIVFNRGKTSNLLYDLARDGEVPYNRSSFDYMNSNIAHPFYSKYGFAVSKILKQEKNFIQPNIPITLKHQKSITQTKNKISR